MLFKILNKAVCHDACSWSMKSKKQKSYLSWKGTIRSYIDTSQLAQYWKNNPRWNIKYDKCPKSCRYWFSLEHCHCNDNLNNCRTRQSMTKRNNLSELRLTKPCFFSDKFFMEFIKLSYLISKSSIANRAYGF